VTQGMAPMPGDLVLALFTRCLKHVFAKVNPIHDVLFTEPARMKVKKFCQSIPNNPSRNESSELIIG